MKEKGIIQCKDCLAWRVSAGGHGSCSLKPRLHTPTPIISYLYCLQAVPRKPGNCTTCCYSNSGQGRYRCLREAIVVDKAGGGNGCSHWWPAKTMSLLEPQVYLPLKKESDMPHLEAVAFCSVCDAYFETAIRMPLQSGKYTKVLVCPQGHAWSLEHPTTEKQHENQL